MAQACLKHAFWHGLLQSNCKVLCGCTNIWCTGGKARASPCKPLVVGRPARAENPALGREWGREGGVEWRGDGAGMGGSGHPDQNWPKQMMNPKPLVGPDPPAQSNADLCQPYHCCRSYLPHSGCWGKWSNVLLSRRYLQKPALPLRMQQRLQHPHARH